MLIYGMNFQSGVIFQKKDSYELFLSISDLEFGKLVRAKIRGFGVVEIFNADLSDAEIFANSCVVKEGLLIGFLSNTTGKITVKRQDDSYTGSIDLSERSDDFKDLDSFVILEGYDKDFLLKEYTRLVAQQNSVIGVSKPYCALVTNYNRIEESIKRAKETNCQVLLMNQQENMEEFVKVSKVNQLMPGIATEFDETKLKELRKKGFEFFQITFAQDRREEVILSRKILKDSIFIARGISPLTGVGLVDGLILDKPQGTTELLKSAVLQNFIRLYVDLYQIEEKVLSLCGILNFGTICYQWSGEVEHAKFYKVRKINNQEHEISYIDKNNLLRKLLVKGNVIETEDVSVPYLKKEVKVRPDGRYFYFYHEG